MKKWAIGLFVVVALLASFQVASVTDSVVPLASKKGQLPSEH